MKLQKTLLKSSITETKIFDIGNDFTLTKTYTNKKLATSTLQHKSGLIPVIVNKKEWQTCRKDYPFSELFYTGPGTHYIGKKFKENTFDFSNVLLLDYNGHLVFDSNMNIQSICHQFDYIGSLKEYTFKDPLFKEIIDRIKNHKYIKSLTIKEIEYYNSQFSGQKGIELGKVFIDQDTYQNLYKTILKKTPKIKYPSVTLRNILQMGYDYCNYRNIDLYGIRDLMKDFHNRNF